MNDVVLSISNNDINVLISSGKTLCFESYLFFQGLKKTATIRQMLKPRKDVCLNIDLKQTGVGGDNSWVALEHEQYRTRFPNNFI